MDAALSGVRGSEPAVLEKLVEAQEQTVQRESAIVMLSAMIVRGAQDAAIQRLFASVADEGRSRWQRSALLRGAEVALLGVAMPGTPTEGRGGSTATPAAALPCPTCPGGRAGPGGAYAFPAPSARGPGAGGRSGGPGLRLNLEPTALSELAARGGDMGARATTLLARVVWPGKPGAAAPIAPLTSAEQQRFDAGREIYKNICQACHQPDGRGQDKLAPTLIGSALALAPADIPARILISGKEGPVGLMPPVGSVLSDDQIAAVLTYIRRDWGQAGSPVDPGIVKDVRALTAGRTRPWTNEELLALVVKAGI